MGDLALRQAVPADAAAVNAIYNHWVMNSTCTYQIEPEGIEETRTRLASHGPAHPFIVAVRGAELVGWGSISPFHGREAYARTVENSLYVHQGHLRQGIGSAILARLVSLADGAGHRVIIARIDSAQAGSIVLHERHGFVLSGRLRDVGYKFDRWLDVVYMTRDLGPAA